MQYLNIGHLVKGDDIGLLSLKDGQSLFGRTACDCRIVSLSSG